MRILFLTQYYPPEVGAPQNRLSDLCGRLMSKGIDITVLTAMPNYPEGRVHDPYRGKLFMTELIEGIKVHRCYIYASRSGSVAARLLNYFSFVFTSMLRLTFMRGSYDYVFCESPPLFSGISAWYASKIKSAKLIFNVSDLWPESAEKLGIISNRTLLNMATRLEEFCYRNSFLITGQTQGIVNNIATRFPNKRVHWLPNGVDPAVFDRRVDSSWRLQNGFSGSDTLFMYAGIHGHAQGLETVLEAAALLRSEENIKILLVGDGPEKEKLQGISAEKKLLNVHFVGLQAAAKMPQIIAATDAAIIPLKKLPLFEGAIPSKIFENLAMGKPLVLGVDGEARVLFIDKANAGLYYEPEDAKAMSVAILELHRNKELRISLGENGKRFVGEHFDRAKIAAGFLEHLLPASSKA